MKNSLVAQIIARAGCFGMLLFFFITAAAQPGNRSSTDKISGKVTDAKGQPVPGAVVRIIVKNLSTKTDSNGDFSMAIKPEDGLVLSVTYVGYQPEEIKLRSAVSVYNVSLKEAVRELNDVVVVGYGTTNRKDITGSVASLKGTDLNSTPISNFGQGLQGRVAGVQVTQNSGQPGGSISLRIRGVNSINGSSEPLYVIDGVQISNDGEVGDLGSLATINPNDIESMEVLKDASATAIYGSRGANGVVLITTKRGKAGPSKLSYDGYFSQQEISKKIKVMNLEQWARLQNGDLGSVPVFPNPEALGPGTDWQDVIYRQAPMHSHNLSLVGGNASTRLSMSGNYLNQDGIIINSNFKRYSFRTNIDHKINDRFKTGTSLFSSYSVYNGITVSGTNGIDATFNGVVGAALAAPPILKPYRPDGSILDFGGQFDGKYIGQTNPLYIASPLQQQAVKRTLGTVFGEAIITKGLTYRASFSADMQSQLNDYYFPIRAITPSLVNNNSGSGSKTNINNLLILHESQLDYQKSFGAHALKLTGVFATQTNRYNSNSMSATGFPNDATSNEALQLAKTIAVLTNRTKYRIDSYMARINYSYKSKYLLDITAREDGSSKFGADNKYGFFPAAAAAWRIIDEPFAHRLDFLSDLKLRISYGMTGNAGALSPYSSLALVGATGVYNFNHIPSNGIAPVAVPNTELRWERSLQTNIGLNLGLFDDRITIVADVYDKTTKDLLYVKRLPLSSGYASVVGNFASIQNKGLEFSLNARVLTGALKWNVNGNISVNRNKVLALDGATDETFLNTYSLLKVGEPVGVFKTYVFDGIYQTGEPILPGLGGGAGSTKVKDINGDGTITSDDQIITGNPNAKFIFGLSNSLTYKNWDFSAFLSGNYGNSVFNNGRFALENPNGGVYNVSAELVDRWTSTNPSNVYPGVGAQGRNVVSDRYVENASFLRCKNLTLGFKFSKVKVVSSIRLYASANNVFLITKYKGYDPEVNTYGNSTTQLGIDNFVYPSAKSFLAGMQVTF